MPENAMFEGFDPTEYEDEVRERWGDTDAYRESTRRAASYGDAERKAIRSEWDEIVGELAAGEAAGGAGRRRAGDDRRRAPPPAHQPLVL